MEKVQGPGIWVLGQKTAWVLRHVMAVAAIGDPHL